MKDPLMHGKSLAHLQERFKEKADPKFVFSLDYSSCWTKTRSKSKSYLPSKTDKNEVRFFFIADIKNLYLPTLSANGSENKVPKNGTEGRCDLFTDKRRKKQNICKNNIQNASTM